VIVVINFTNRKQDDYVINFPRKGTWKVRFNSSWKGYSSDFEELGVSETIVEKDNGKINLPSYSVLILSQDS
jgi:1,4-alpha-glucan branching enzyme